MARLESVTVLRLKYTISIKTYNKMSALTKTDFEFPGQQGVYHGKVRDVYNLGDKLVMVAKIGRAHV